MQKFIELLKEIIMFSKIELHEEVINWNHDIFFVITIMYILLLFILHNFLVYISFLMFTFFFSLPMHAMLVQTYIYSICPYSYNM